MRKDIPIILGETDRRWLEALVADRNTSRKHVWRARIVLPSADGADTNGIMAATGHRQDHVLALEGAVTGGGCRGTASRKDPSARHGAGC